VDSMSRCRHRHLVALVGVCVSDNQCVLVYEYMVNGSLEDHLYAARPDAEKVQGRGERVFLTWPMRLKIALGTAKGLAYLHEVRLILFRHALSFESSLPFMDLWRPSSNQGWMGRKELLFLVQLAVAAMATSSLLQRFLTIASLFRFPSNTGLFLKRIEHLGRLLTSWSTRHQDSMVQVALLYALSLNISRMDAAFFQG
jgi:hypothetical protein